MAAISQQLAAEALGYEVRCLRAAARLGQAPLWFAMRDEAWSGPWRRTEAEAWADAMEHLQSCVEAV